jgi:hypothetical protein
MSSGHEGMARISVLIARLITATVIPITIPLYCWQVSVTTGKLVHPTSADESQAAVAVAGNLQLLMLCSTTKTSTLDTYHSRNCLDATHSKQFGNFSYPNTGLPPYPRQPPAGQSMQ